MSSEPEKKDNQEDGDHIRVRIPRKLDKSIAEHMTNMEMWGARKTELRVITVIREWLKEKKRKKGRPAPAKPNNGQAGSN